MNFNVIIQMYLLTQSATSPRKILLNNTSSQIFFTKIGKLYSHVSYATLRIKVDLVPLKTEDEKFYSEAKEIQQKLKVLLMDCEARENQGIT